MKKGYERCILDATLHQKGKGTFMSERDGFFPPMVTVCLKDVAEL